MLKDMIARADAALVALGGAILGAARTATAADATAAAEEAAAFEKRAEMSPATAARLAAYRADVDAKNAAVRQEAATKAPGGVNAPGSAEVALAARSWREAAAERAELLAPIAERLEVLDKAMKEAKKTLSRAGAGSYEGVDVAVSGDGTTRDIEKLRELADLVGADVPLKPRAFSVTVKLAAAEEAEDTDAAFVAAA